MGETVFWVVVAIVAYLVNSWMGRVVDELAAIRGLLAAIEDHTNPRQQQENLFAGLDDLKRAVSNRQ